MCLCAPCPRSNICVRMYSACVYLMGTEQNKKKRNCSDDGGQDKTKPFYVYKK